MKPQCTGSYRKFCFCLQTLCADTTFPIKRFQRKVLPRMLGGPEHGRGALKNAAKLGCSLTKVCVAGFAAAMRTIFPPLPCSWKRGVQHLYKQAGHSPCLPHSLVKQCSRCSMNQITTLNESH